MQIASIQIRGFRRVSVEPGKSIGYIASASDNQVAFGKLYLHDGRRVAPCIREGLVMRSLFVIKVGDGEVARNIVEVAVDFESEKSDRGGRWQLWVIIRHPSCWSVVAGDW